MTASSPLALASAETVPWSAFRRRLLSFVEHRTADASEAEDIVQSVLGRAAGELEAGRQHGDMVAWLFQMTRNALVDHYRRRTRRERQVERLAAEAEDGGFVVPQEDEPAGIDSFAACVRPMVAALPEPYGSAVRRVDLEGASQVDLAKELGLAASGAKSRVQRGRAMLREAFLRCCVAERRSADGGVRFEPKAESCSPSTNMRSSDPQPAVTCRPPTTG
jgi:RNA polymerase sigma-70 factor (ECF subfamily)